MEYSKRKGLLLLLGLIVLIKPVFARTPILPELPENSQMIEGNTLVGQHFIALNASQTRVYASVADNYPESNYGYLLRQYDWDDKLMEKIMFCESSNNPRAYNPERHRGCSGSYGLLQVACLHFQEGDDRYDPATNVKRAYETWKKQGYVAWKNCWNKVR